MTTNLIVIGGWATPASVLTSVFGDEAQYYDCNFLWKDIIENDRLTSDWEKRLADKIPTSSDSIIAGWSTGAIVAWSLAQQIIPKELILLSSTPSFCRRDNWRLGQRPSILQSMQKALFEDKTKVLTDFYTQSGLPLSLLESLNYTTEELVSGLIFLEKASLLPITKMAIPLTFMHGKDDLIIPIEAGQYFCESAGGKFRPIEGSHAFFSDRVTEGRVTEWQSKDVGLEIAK